MTAIYIPAYAEPLELTEVLRQLKQDGVADETEELLITSHLSAARGVAEIDSGANMPYHWVGLATTFELVLDDFPCDAIRLTRAPLISVTSITYLDTAGATQTVAAADYIVDKPNNRIRLAYNESWPSSRGAPDSVTVRYVAGLVAPFTVVPGTDACTAKGRTFTDTERVRVFNTKDLLPTGLAKDTDYFIRDASGSTFKLAATSGGTAIDITTTGSGLHYVSSRGFTGFQNLRAAILLQLSHWYYNRQRYAIEPGISMVEVPGYASLVGALDA